jgi:hypothetical protein
VQKVALDWSIRKRVPHMKMGLPLASRRHTYRKSSGGWKGAQSNDPELQRAVISDSGRSNGQLFSQALWSSRWSGACGGEAGKGPRTYNTHNCWMIVLTRGRRTWGRSRVSSRWTGHASLGRCESSDPRIDGSPRPGARPCPRRPLTSTWRTNDRTCSAGIIRWIPASSGNVRRM